MKSKLIITLITVILIFSACKSKTSPENPEISTIKNNFPVEFTGAFQ